MSLYAIADLHLSFGEDVDKPMDIYGEAWENHHQRLKENWQNLIKEGDTVIIAGDISWGLKLSEAMPDLLWIAELPGQKVLIKGNHDPWWSSISKLRGIHESLFFLQNDCYEGENFVIAGSRGWICPGDEDFEDASDEKIYLRENIRLELSLKAAERLMRDSAKGKVLIGALHYPPTSGQGGSSGFTDLFEKFGVSHVVYGHLHGPAAHSKAIQGDVRGVHYSLCSLDKLGCVPKLILE